MVNAADFAQRVIAIAGCFIGYREVKENAVWMSPDGPHAGFDGNAWLRKWMALIPGWEPGAPYCAAFAGACVANALKQLDGTTGAITRWRNNWTAGCMNNVEHWQNMGRLSKEPSVGSILLMQHGQSWQGHACLVTAIHGTTVATIEGNTNAEGSREGDGVFTHAFDYTAARGDLHTRGFVSAASILAVVGA